VQDLLPGQVLDQYQVIDVLARSGMASLYRARDLDDGRTVVLKVPYPQYESDIVFHVRLERERDLRGAPRLPVSTAVELASVIAEAVS
jgi:eukaryotic-like serine/threonine-protein kinase